MSLERWKQLVEKAKNHLQLVKERKADFVKKSKEGIAAQSIKEYRIRAKENFARQILHYNANVEQAQKELAALKANKDAYK